MGIALIITLIAAVFGVSVAARTVRRRAGYGLCC
jgi:hypothetical protein